MPQHRDKIVVIYESNPCPSLLHFIDCLFGIACNTKSVLLQGGPEKAANFQFIIVIQPLNKLKRISQKRSRGFLE